MNKSKPQTSYVKNFPILKYPDPIRLSNGWYIVGPFKTVTERYCVIIKTGIIDNCPTSGETVIQIFADTEQISSERVNSVLKGFSLSLI